ncbi:MAG: hypothetical protein ACFFCO_03365 [Promethearchaeota archaeon]
MKLTKSDHLERELFDLESIKSNGGDVMVIINARNKQSRVPQMQLGERASTGCRNPRPTANHRLAFVIMLSRQ